MARLDLGKDSTEEVDVVNSPPHYNTGNIETIEAIEDWNLGFHLGNAVKYISRAGHKGENKAEEDLRKAIWYIERYIDHVLNAHDVVVGNIYANDEPVETFEEVVPKTRK